MISNLSGKIRLAPLETLRFSLLAPRKLLDVSKARALGWEARTPLETGIRLAYDDFLQNPMRAER